ncbi:hypothetical protein [uncultured Tateyamaria sp.]|nr:hypothetical protein [uncultured Tateyamaria sp.]
MTSNNALLAHIQDCQDKACILDGLIHAIERLEADAQNRKQVGKSN